jgi:hypothetical protein
LGGFDEGIASTDRAKVFGPVMDAVLTDIAPEVRVGVVEYTATELMIVAVVTHALATYEPATSEMSIVPVGALPCSCTVKYAPITVYAPEMSVW